ncbi:hypothetical protein VTH06DRAFT_8380 [Thermothelomyces fergusii]
MEDVPIRRRASEEQWAADVDEGLFECPGVGWWYRRGEDWLVGGRANRGPRDALHTWPGVRITEEAKVATEKKKEFL